MPHNGSNGGKYMPKVTITISDEMWEWWQRNKWINLSQLADRELRRMRSIDENNARVGGCPTCGHSKLKFIDGIRYRCTKCGRET